ncbi:MAG: hypothetical protein LBV20_01560 [Treponema sp.]|nr:hypothetical protein [Treponema sp.]
MKKILVLIPIFLSVVFLISCGTTAESTPDPVTPPPSGASVDFSAERARAESARESARSIRADVAVKDDFNNAVNVFNTAESAANPAAAFTEAERLFNAARDKAQTLRDAAMSELEKAQAEIKNAEDEAAAYETERAAEESAQGAM